MMEWIRKSYLDLILVPLAFMIIISYHVWLWHKVRTQPLTTIIGTNAIGRRLWVSSMMKDNDKKNILAVQSLRNAVMGSTLMATTSILLCSGLAAVISSTYSVKKPLDISDTIYGGHGEFMPIVLLIGAAFFSAMSNMGFPSWPSEAELNVLRAVVSGMSGRDAAEVRVVVSPYRICPLGAHIDHQGGIVSAMTINKGVLLGFIPSGDPQVVLRSGQFHGEVRFRVDDVQQPKHAIRAKEKANDCSKIHEECIWGNYARGALVSLDSFVVLKDLIVQALALQLLLLLVFQAGVAYLLALECANNLIVSPTENIELDRLIENEYLGVRNGILDQSAVLLSRHGCLTCMNCKTKEHKLIHPPKLQKNGVSEEQKTYKILLAFSGLKQALTSNPGYNQRVAECREAARLLLEAQSRRDDTSDIGRLAEVFKCGVGTFPSTYLGLPHGGRISLAILDQSVLKRIKRSIRNLQKGSSEMGNPLARLSSIVIILERASGNGQMEPLLCNVEPAAYEANKYKLESSLARRAEHYFSENMRVTKGLEAWASGKWEEFGKLISASGLSSIQNYECGCEPLIQLYEILLRAPGVFGARFSGAGFRGCCLAFVESHHAAEAVSFVRNEYPKLQPQLASNLKKDNAVLICEAGDCAHVI
ncbi:hypothetical protein IFM89_037363 [Coptis chinensis]|uniref:GHMP kinase C-terminal domain-containing protein n=1 Tax=Coptis chinensis TaxID=261450 RepID=A0A835IGU1_9MAGN|nr:hypothetical protein IFM89_037363 [Coptis chinensis]